MKRSDSEAVKIITIMKKILYIFSTLLLLAGCRQESMHYEIPQPEDALHLRASRDSVVLAQRYAGEDAITFTWDTPEPLEGTTGYDYYFKMDIAGNGFETSISKLSVKGMQSLSFTHAELNAMLEQWGVSPSTWMQIEAELIANPLGSETYIKPMLSTATFDAVGFANYMYIAGSATAAGYDYANALVMDKIAGENAYTYRGVMQPGEFVFLMEQSAEADFIGMGADERQMVHATAETVKGIPVQQEGFYAPEVNLDRMTLVLNQPLALVGDATPAGWSLKDAPFMEQLGETRLTWTGPLLKGEMKLACNPTSGYFEDAFYTAAEPNVTTEGTSAMVFHPHGTTSEDDFKWQCPSDGIYKVDADMSNRTLSFSKLCDYAYVYLCGSATPSGWDTPFTQSCTYIGNGKFQWEGALTPGEIKFPLTTSDYQGPTLMAMAANTPVVIGEPMGFFCAPKGDPDQKWIVKEGGEYTITIDVINNKVTFEK